MYNRKIKAFKLNINSMAINKPSHEALDRLAKEIILIENRRKNDEYERESCNISA